MRFALLNASDVSSETMSKIADCMRLYLEDVCKAWEHAPIDLAWMPTVKVAPDGWIAVVAFGSVEVAGALAYHSVDPRGIAYARAFVPLFAPDKMLFDSAGNGDSLCGALMHEVAEVVGDETANEWVEGPLIDARSGYQWKYTARELCDPVQSIAYQKVLQDGSKADCSDFVLGEYFNAALKGSGRVYDFCGKLTDPLTIAPGSYAIVSDGTTDDQVMAKKVGWRVFHEQPETLWRTKMRQMPGARSHHRMGT